MRKFTEVSQCYACHNTYIFSLMKPIILVEPDEEGIRKTKRYLCPTCSDKFKKLKYIQRSREKLKKGMKRVVKEIREKDERSL